jgi:pSer/pThr/pTyr-binding forkhead associated (FHA) protein
VLRPASATVVGTLAPVSVALKFGFLAVLYLFLLWVARSALRDLRGSRPATVAPDPSATGLYSASVSPLHAARDARLVVERAPGHAPGMIYDIGDGAVLGRGDEAEIRLDDPYASSRHAQLVLQAGVVVLEDLGSTNGTYLNEERLQGPAPLHDGDRVRIGDSEFTFEEGR